MQNVYFIAVLFNFQRMDEICEMIDDSNSDFSMDSSEVATQPPMSEDEDQNQYFDDSEVTLPRQLACGAI